MVDGQVALVTRNSKQMVFLQHIRKAVKKFLSRYEDVILDGELYAHKPDIEYVDTAERFNFISSCCRTSMSNPNLH